MHEKEWRDALKRFVESLIALLVIPIVSAWDKLVAKAGLDDPSLLRAGFVVTLIVFAVYAGGTVFQSERRDRAYEYLFSLPLGRPRIIVAKVLPRFALLLVLGALATAFVGRGLAVQNGVVFLVLFFGSLFLSLGVFSLVINACGVLIIYLIYAGGLGVAGYVLTKLGLGRETLPSLLAPQLASAAVLLVPFGLAFWLTFKRMDARPLKLQMRTSYAIILPTVLILVSLIVAFFSTIGSGARAG